MRKLDNGGDPYYPYADFYEQQVERTYQAVLRRGNNKPVPPKSRKRLAS